MARHTAQQPEAPAEATIALDAILTDLGLPVVKDNPRYQIAAQRIATQLEYQRQIGMRMAAQTMNAAMQELGL